MSLYACFYFTDKKSFSNCNVHLFSYFSFIAISDNDAHHCHCSMVSLPMFVYMIIIMVIAYYISSGSWSRLETMIFLNLTLTLIFTYFLFVTGAHVTSITTLCAVVSALLQLLMMVFFCWTIVLALCLYLNLGEVPKHLQKKLLCSSMCASWSKLYYNNYINACTSAYF